MGGERTVDPAGFDVGQAFGELGIDDSSLIRGGFVVCGQKLRMELITPPETLNSISWPLLRPAFRRTDGGTTSGVLFLTVTVIISDTTDEVISLSV